MNKVLSTVATAAVAASVAGGLSACGNGSGYAPVYVVGETYCGAFQTCAVLSDGDVVGPLQPSQGTVLAGMILSPYGSGYRFTRQPASQHVSYTHITNIYPASRYADDPPVSPAAEVSQQKSGKTYNSGTNPRYSHSSAYKKAQAGIRANKAAARAAQKAAKQGYVRQGSRSSYRSSTTRSRYGK